MAPQNDGVKVDTLRRIGDVEPQRAPGPSNYRVGDHVVHARFCRVNQRSPHLFKFNINPNTLQADFELWICGSSALFYLIPTSVIRRIYTDPETYQDYHHPDIRVVSVDSSRDRVIYKRGGGSLNVGQYKTITIRG